MLKIVWIVWEGRPTVSGKKMLRVIREILLIITFVLQPYECGSNLKS